MTKWFPNADQIFIHKIYIPQSTLKFMRSILFIDSMHCYVTFHDPTFVFSSFLPSESEALWPKISDFNSHEGVTCFFFITPTPRVCPRCPSSWQCESTRVENRRLNKHTKPTENILRDFECFGRRIKFCE